MSRTLLASLLSLVVAAMPACSGARPAPVPAPPPVASVTPAAPACFTGIYRSSAGEGVSLTQRTGHPGSLRVNDLDGRAGVLEGAAGALVATAKPGDPAAITGTLRYASCDGPDLELRLGEGGAQRWTRLPLRVTRTRFRSGAVELEGELLEPDRAGEKPPLFVLVHGSESTPAIGAVPLPYLMALQGIAAFVFDKRGTGGSGGTYTQDFEALADDVVAAVLAARRLAGDRVGRVGLAGFSQGGWVAPLAATRTPVDFVAVGYGVVGTPIEQDEWQVAYQLREAGFSDADLDRARIVTGLAGRVAASDFREGLPELQAAVRRFAGEPWLSKIDGQYSGELVRGEIDRARRESPGVIWHYDALSVLGRLRAPQLWVLAQDDSVAPSAPTLARLGELRQAGKPIALAVFPGTDHGIRRFSRGPGGARTSLGYAPGYHRLLADWMNGAAAARYGDAVLSR